MSVPSSVIAAGIGLHQADDHVERRGLAGAVRAEQPDRLAAAHRDRDVPHHRALLVGLADAVRDQAGAAGDHAQVARASAPTAELAEIVHRAACASGPARRLAGFARLGRRAPASAGGVRSPAVAASLGTTSPAPARPAPDSRRAMPVFMFTSASGAVQLVLAARDAHVADDAGDAGIGHVDAAVAGHVSVGGAHRDMAERLDLLELAGRRRSGSPPGLRRSAGGGVLAATCVARRRRRRRLALIGRGVGDQRVGGDAAAVLGHHHGVAARHRHVLLRPVFQRVARRQHLVRRGQLQVVAGHHQHRLVDVVDRVVAPAPDRSGCRCARCPRPPAGRSRCRRCRPRPAPAALRPAARRRGRRASAAARPAPVGLLAVMRDQPVGIDGHVAAHRARVAVRDHLLLVLVPVDAVLRGHRRPGRPCDRSSCCARAGSAGSSGSSSRRGSGAGLRARSFLGRRSAPAWPGR